MSGLLRSKWVNHTKRKKTNYKNVNAISFSKEDTRHEKSAVMSDGKTMQTQATILHKSTLIYLKRSNVCSCDLVRS